MQNYDPYIDLYTLSGNERRLLDLIWRRESVARKDLAKETGLTGASATRLTKKIVSLNLVEESVEKGGNRGSPNRPLRKKVNCYYSIGLCFDKYSITMVLVCVKGQIIERKKVSTKQINIDSFSTALEGFIDSSKVLAKRTSTLLGIGVAIPGYRAICDQQWAIHWDYDSLLDVSIEQELYSRLMVPVIVERDAICALWAERLQGTCKDIDDFFILYMAQGVGGCAMINGEPVVGARGNAGGVGILFPYDQPRPSAKNYKDFLRECQLSQKNNFNLSKVIDLWVDKVTPNLSHCIDTLSRLYDPSSVVLSGDLPKPVIKRLASELNNKEIKTGYTASIGVSNVICSSFDETISLIGASVLPISSIISGSYSSRIGL